MFPLERRRTSYAIVREALLSAIQLKRPGSLIRIGDGESVILSYNPKSPPQDLSSHLRLWFGNSQPNNHQLVVLRDRLQAACRSAMFLGIPTLRQCKLHERYEVSYQCLERILRRRNQVILTDAAVHRFLHLSGDLLACLRGSPFIGLVTSQPVSDLVSKYFCPFELFVKRIPNEFSPELSPSSSVPISWLDKNNLFNDFRIHPPYRGAPYLVGAGLMGKLICDQIRRAGGFAIDIGSILDGWVTINSRAYFNTYPISSYQLEHALPLSFLGFEQRLDRFLALAAANEACPESFCLQ